LKEWNYLKKLSEDDMKIVVAKVDKRSREGKKTVVNHAGSMITEERIRNFKRRKTVKNSEAMSPSAGEWISILSLTYPSYRGLQLIFMAETPSNVTYGTPRSENDTALSINSISGQETSQEGQDLQLLDWRTKVLENHAAITYSDQESSIKHASLIEFSQNTAVAEHSSTMAQSPSLVVSSENIRTIAIDATLALDSSPQDIGLRETNSTLDDPLSQAPKKVLFVDEPLYIPSTAFCDALLPDITKVLNKITFYEDEDELDKAISMCSKAINRYKETKALCKLQSKLAYLLKRQNSMEESVAMYRRALSGYEDEFGMTANATLEIRHFLIDILIAEANYEEALILCLSEMSNFTEDDDVRVKVKCRATLSAIYRKQEKNEEALRHLIFGIAQLLQRDPTTIQLYGLLKAIAELFQANPNLLSPLESHCPGKTKELFLLLDQMRQMARNYLEWDFGDFPLLMFKAMRLAWLFSYLEDKSRLPLDQQMTESLFRVGLSRLEPPENKTTEKKATVYAWYAAYLNRQRCPVRCALYFLASGELFMKCEKTPRVVQALSMIVQRLRKMIPIINKRESNELSAEIESFLRCADVILGQGVSKSADIGHDDGGFRVNNWLELVDPELPDIEARTCSSKEDDGKSIFTNTTGTSSLRFGVTFSKSEYQGYNIGELIHIIHTGAFRK
jgi:tetratricopeptide (TPR) repeat protein